MDNFSLFVDKWTTSMYCEEDMASAAPRMDELVKEYLLYRGFTGCIRVLDGELKTDKEKALRVDKIVEQLNSYISAHDLSALWEYWNSLNVRFFSRLEQRYMSTVMKLEQNLLKQYVVVAYQGQRSDKVREFFEVMAQDLHGQEAFKDWFAFPFLKNVEDQPCFSLYFTKQWQDTFNLSLANFLSVVINAMQSPVLLGYDSDLKKMKTLQDENNVLKMQLKSVCGDGGDGTLSLKPRGLTGASTNTFELMDDFFISGDQSIKREKSAQLKTEKKKTAIGTILSGFKGQTTTTNQNAAKRPSAPLPSIQQNYKVNKSKVVDDKIVKPPKVSLFQNTVSSNSKNTRANLPEQSPQKGVPPVCDGHLAKVEDRLIASSPVVARKFADASPQETQKTTLTGTLRGVKDSLLKHSSPAKTVPKCSSGFTSYITKPAPTDAMAISHTDADSPFILLSQESYDEHSSMVTSVRFSYSSQFITSVDRDGIVKIWTWSPQPVTKATVMLKPAFLSAEWANKTDRHVLLGTKTGNIRLYDVKENKSVCEVPTDASYPNVVGLCPNPSGTQFVSSGVSDRARTSVNGGDNNVARAGKLSVWELKTMKVLSHLAMSPSPIAINCMTFNHNGQLLLTGAADGRIRLYDINQTMCINDWAAHNGDVTAIQFSSDETSCYSMGTDDKFLQWSMTKCGQQLADIQLHGGACNPVTMTTETSYQGYLPHGKLFSFDAEGNYILTCGRSGGSIYELSDICASSVMDLRRHRSPVSTIDWSPAVDTRVCITGSFDGRVVVSSFLSR